MWYLAVLVSWGIAFFEYVLQVPANRIGSRDYSFAELKILQEVISLTVFVPIAVFCFRQQIKWDYLWASLCIVGAVFFMFRERIAPTSAPIVQVSDADPETAPDK